MSWLLWALVSAVAAALTTILAKVGIATVPSTLATAIRTVVVLAISWALVYAQGQQRELSTISARSLLFLTLSGIATGISWLAYFKALQIAPASWVAPIDKLSLPITIVLAAIWLREPMNYQAGFGVALMTAGSLLIWYASR